MDMRITGLGSPGLYPTPEIATPATRETGGLFASLMNQGMSEVSQQHTQANQALEDLAFGRSDNMHQAMLRIAQADLSFRFLLEVRNKLIDAYQEIMRMQV